MRALLMCLALASASGDQFTAWVAETTELETLPESAGQRLAPAELVALANGKPTLPFSDLTVGLRDEQGGVWAGSRRGLMFLAPGATRWRLFHSQRWLADDDVQDLAISADSKVLVRTPEGICSLVRERTTMDKKMAAINDTLAAHHVREGLVGGVQLKQPGRVDGGHLQHHNDNDGLWTSLYIASEAFRYAATGDASAKCNARRSLDALMFLERITGISGFAARSIWPASEPKPPRGEWHLSADKKWWWKGDTSSDEVDGHYFAYSIYHDVAADEAERAEIREYVRRITDHILDHGLYYVGPSGEPTTWGVWAPEKLNHDLRRLGDRGLNSLEILSFLKVAEHIVGDPRYAAKSRELVEQHSYEANTVFQKHAWPTNRVNHSDDELAFLAYYPLLIHERDEGLRRIYQASLRRTWHAERPEHSPFFNLIVGASRQADTWTKPTERPAAALVDRADYDHDECVAWFQDVPSDTTSWTILNSGRNDLGPLATNRFNRLCSQSVVLPASERPVMRWNGDPYLLDGGSEGRYRDDGAAILLPYWMGRYHRLID